MCKLCNQTSASSTSRIFVSSIEIVGVIKWQSRSWNDTNKRHCYLAFWASEEFSCTRSPEILFIKSVNILRIRVTGSIKTLTKYFLSEIKFWKNRNYSLTMLPNILFSVLEIKPESNNKFLFGCCCCFKGKYEDFLLEKKK